MNWSINPKEVEESFDRIAKSLLQEYVIVINDKEFRLTEIEFYFFHPDHQDNYTHVHRQKEGAWRFHNQGLDITLQGNKEQDGGILIRGLKHDKYVNGPGRIIRALFENFGKVDSSNIIQLNKITKQDKQIIKTFRHLPNKIEYAEFHHKYYRYLVDIEKLPQIPNSEKNKIKSNSVIL